MSEIHDFSSRRRKHAQIGSDPVLLVLGDQIRATRIAMGMTQEELALITGVGRDCIMKLENGKAGIAIGKVSAVLTALGLKLTAIEN